VPIPIAQHFGNVLGTNTDFQWENTESQNNTTVPAFKQSMIKVMQIVIGFQLCYKSPRLEKI